LLELPAAFNFRPVDKNQTGFKVYKNYTIKKTAELALSGFLNLTSNRQVNYFFTSMPLIETVRVEEFFGLG